MDTYLFYALVLFQFWIGYLAVMSLYRAYLNKTLVGPAKYLGYATVAAFVVLDWAINWTFAVVYFSEFPKSWRELVTARLQRYRSADYPQGKNKQTADVICTALNIFDPTADGHC